MGNFISEAFDEVKDVWDDVRGAVGDSGLGMILGAALAPVTAGMSLQWGATIGGAVGGAYSDGLSGALAGGLGGYGLGGGVQSLVGTGPYTSPSANFKSPARPTAPTAQLSTAGTGMTGSAPGIAGTRVGQAALANPITLTDTPSIITDDRYGVLSEVTPSVPEVPLPTPKPPWQKALEGAAIFSPLLGIGENIDYDEIPAPDAQPSIVDQYYSDVAQYGEANVPRPAQLARPATPTTFGSRRLAREARQRRR